MCENCEFNIRWQHLIFKFIICIVQLGEEDCIILADNGGVSGLAVQSNSSNCVELIPHRHQRTLLYKVHGPSEAFIDVFAQTQI